MVTETDAPAARGTPTPSEMAEACWQYVVLPLYLLLLARLEQAELWFATFVAMIRVLSRSDIANALLHRADRRGSNERKSSRT